MLPGLHERLPKDLKDERLPEGLAKDNTSKFRIQNVMGVV